MRALLLAAPGILIGLRAAALPLPQGTLPSFVVVMTDDQRWDTLWAMPRVRALLSARGVTFTQAIVATPLCCPARASFLSGGFYAHETGVLTNLAPNGGVTRFRDDDTLATRLRARGYRTAMIGKYMNGYWEAHARDSETPYIPPGWTRFVRAAGGEDWVSYPVVRGTSPAAAPSRGGKQHVEQYLTDFLRDEALRFLRESGDAPFFLYLAPFAPHPPAIPAARDAELFSDFRYRGRGYGEADLSDKPDTVRRARPFDAAEADAFHRDQLRSLQAVDRAVAALVRELEALGRLDDTLIFFTSDNGFLWGEHGLRGKDRPYEEALRVPLVVSHPGLAPREQPRFVVANLDVPTTILELVRDPRAAETDGVSLLPLLEDPATSRGRAALIQSYRSGRLGVPGALLPWAGFRSGQRYKYVEHASGEIELYDLERDPYELDNLAARPDLDASLPGGTTSIRAKLEELGTWVARRRGLSITLSEPLPAARVGEPYAFRVPSWGGRTPLRWSWLPSEAPGLPRGLALDAASGWIRGLPREPGLYALDVQVEDASRTAHGRGPQRFVAAGVELEVLPEPGPLGLAVSGAVLGALASWRRARSRRPSRRL